jgi:hypothetical protein
MAHHLLAEMVEQHQPAQPQVAAQQMMEAVRVDRVADITVAHQWRFTPQAQENVRAMVEYAAVITYLQMQVLQ